MYRWTMIFSVALLLHPACARRLSEGAKSQLICTSPNCGVNSAFVNGSVLGALPLGGQRNRNGFSIEPTLHPRDGRADAALRLDVREGQIVGVDGKDEVVAMGDELKGRWFRLLRRGSDGASEERGKVRIVDVAFVRLMARRTHHALDPDRSEPEAPIEDEVAVGYELEYEPESSSARATNLCRYKAPLFLPHVVAQMSTALKKVENTSSGSGRSLRSKLEKRIRELPRSIFDTVRRELSLDEPSALMFAIKGEAYNEITATIDQEPESFNLACPSTALSKMKLMGYDPQDRRFITTRAQRLAVLKMITARYCDAKNFTVDGQPLSWENRDQWFSWSADGDVEALWNENGAICLNRPRMSIYTRQMITDYCRDLPPCSASVNRKNVPDGAELMSIIPR